MDGRMWFSTQFTSTPLGDINGVRERGEASLYLNVLPFRMKKME